MAKKPNKPFVPSNASTWNPEDGEENLVINNNGDLNIWLGREDLQEYHERKRLKQSSSAAEGSNTTEGSTQSSNTSESLKQSSDTTEDFVQSNSTEDSKQGSNAIENLKQSFYTTPVSKKAGNGNARRHGAYSNGLLPWESEEEFRALHEDLQKEWKPDGASEKELVLDLAQWRWKRRRALQGSQISYFRSPVPDQLKSGALSWDDVVEHQATVP